MKTAEKDTEQHILQIAREVFFTQGLAGSRMQEIADRAGVNKALLHYYFQNKETLFGVVVKREMQNLFSSILEILAGTGSLAQKIEQIVAVDIDKFSRFPNLPIFIMNEVSKNVAILKEHFNKKKFKYAMEIFTKDISKAQAAGIIDSITAMELLMTIQSLCIYPFLARPIVQHLFEIPEKEFIQKIQERKQRITDIIFKSIKVSLS